MTQLIPLYQDDGMWTSVICHRRYEKMNHEAMEGIEEEADNPSISSISLW